MSPNILLLILGTIVIFLDLYIMILDRRIKKVIADNYKLKSINQDLIKLTRSTIEENKNLIDNGLKLNNYNQKIIDEIKKVTEYNNKLIVTNDKLAKVLKGILTMEE